MNVRFLRPVALVCTVFVMATAGESLMAQQGRPIPAPAPIGNQPRLGITASPTARPFTLRPYHEKYRIY